MISKPGSLDHDPRKHLIQPMTTSEKEHWRKTQNDLKVHPHGSNGAFSMEAAFFRESEKL